ADYSGTYGLVIIIKHEDGSETRYAHCSTIKVEVGEVVEQGQIIGNIGDTGFVTGPHLHFEIRFDGQTVNPLEYVRLYK
ncbi:MAG: M23 family metallopeptidase, partial [Clostridia bacterium]|nr:M23 family metallopeptidase [Clostridia bacterium]